MPIKKNESFSMITAREVIKKNFPAANPVYYDNFEGNEAIIFNPQPDIIIVITSGWTNPFFICIKKFDISLHNEDMEVKRIYCGEFPPNEIKDGIDEEFLTKILLNWNAF